MIGPTKRPHDFGFRPNDSHIIINDVTERARAFSAAGKLLWDVPALARGQGADSDWAGVGTDTPPGLYVVSAIYRDYEADPVPPYSRTAIAYGWFSFDLDELEGQEKRYGRAGIMIHGGGTACGWPGAWEPKQPLVPTLGCVRMHNQDLRDRLLPLTVAGKVFVSVYQEG